LFFGAGVIAAACAKVIIRDEVWFVKAIWPYIKSNFAFVCGFVKDPHCDGFGIIRNLEGLVKEIEARHLERVMNFAQGLLQAVSGDASVVEMADSAWADSFVVLLAEAADVVDLARVVEVVGDHHGDDPARLLHPE